jgi:zinc D-Ala-D-Ala dipeptidase
MVRISRVCWVLLLLQVGTAQQVSFRITPLRPVEELRAEALKESPPREQGTFLAADLVELVRLDPTIKLDIRYASSNNFLGTPLYTQARAFLQRPAAEAVVRAHREVKAQGYGLIIHDGYRPWYVTEIFWKATPDDKKIFVANPAQGSRHNRGCAVDLSLYDLRTGKEVEMPSGYDEMTKRSYADYPGGTVEERARRALLRHAMEKQGFAVNPDEWWHFDYKDWKRYPIQNARFEDLGK